jgi:glycosyltransferase involved in cell wall biosynthesis
MKILFILTYYYPHWTGLTQYAKRLAEGLAKQGYRITVLTTQHELSLKTNERIAGVSVLRKPVLFRFSRTLISIAFLYAFIQ